MRKSTFSRGCKFVASLMVVCMLVACLPLSLIASAYQLNADTVLADVEFDENNIVLNFGVIADQHITYSGYSHDTVKNKVQQYANAVAALNKAAGNKLDGVLNTGDFTSHGNAYQAENFTSATKAIFDAVNADAAATGITTKFMIAYGNHDTSWRSNMPISDYAYDANTLKEQNLSLGTGTSLSGQSDTWEEILNEYGLLDDQGAVAWDDIDGDGNDDYLEGTYLYTLTARNGKKYYFIALETVDYAPNEYDNSTVNWLDKKLAEITAADPTAYVYIGSHAPIAGSGVYGTNPTYDKNAGWGSTDNNVLHNVLKKYPQVVYFSGHTHYGTIPETAIMSDTYTAIAVSAMAESGIFASASGYDYDNAGTSKMKNTGLNLLVQVDANGNQRIKRVVTPTDYTNVKLMNLASETAVGTITNYDGNTWAPIEGANSKWNIVKTTGATLNTSALDTYDVAIFGEDYLMPAPDAENNHLKYYSKARGEGANIAFENGATATIEDALYSSKTGISAVVKFDAATADRNILQYRVTFKSEKGATLGTKMVLGNIFDVTSGIANGTSHLDATKFSYSMSNISMNNTPFYAEIVAVDEYYNTSAPIVTNVITPDDSGDAPMFNAAIHHNYFDDMQTTDVKKINSSGATYFSMTEGYKTFTASWTNSTMSSSAWNKTTFWLDAAGYNTWQSATNNGNNSWGTNQVYHMYSTPFDENDTFIYQATFNVSKYDTGHISFNFRSEEKTACAGTSSTDNTRDANDVDREGLRISSSGVELVLGNAAQDLVGTTNTSFKLSADNKDHVVTIYSTPEKVSVWIDDSLIFYNVAFPNRENISTMYPSTTIWVGDIDCTMKDFKLWDPTKTETVSTVGPLDGGAGYTDNLLIRPTYEINSTTMYTEYDNDSIYFNALEASQGTDSLAYFDLFVDGNTSQLSPFKSTDTVTFEFTYTIDTVYTYNKNNCHDIMVYFRGSKTSPTSEHVYLLLRSGNTLLHGPGGYSGKLSNTNYVTAGNTYKVKIVSDNTKCSIYINDVAIAEDFAYSSHANIAGVSANNKPGFGLVFRDIEATVTDFKISCNGSYGKALENITAPTDENNLVLTHGNWSSGYKGTKWGLKSNGNNAYFNNYCKAMVEDGQTGYWSECPIYPLTGYAFDNTKSYVVSAQMAKSNRQTHPSTIGNSSTSYFSSRITVNFGSYDGANVSMFMDDSNYYIYNKPGTGNTGFIASDLIKGIDLNEYFRFTAVISPFAVDVYIDGKLLTSFDIPDPSKFAPNIFFKVNGSEVWFKDVAIWENTDNGQLYYDGMLEKYNFLTAEKKGVRLEYSDYDLNTLASVKTALDSFNGTSNAVLAPYVSALNGISLPVIANNSFVDGTVSFAPTGAAAFTPTKDGFIYDLSQAGYNKLNQSNVNIDYDVSLFTTHPFSATDKWVIEYDLTVTDKIAGTSDQRLKLILGSVTDANGKTGAPTIMLQGTGCLINGWKESGSKYDWISIGQTGVSWNVDNTTSHVKYVVNGNKSVVFTITSGTKSYTYTYDLEEVYGAGYTFTPAFKLSYKKAKMNVTNFYVGYDVTDAYNKLNATTAEYATKDTNGFTAETVKNFTDALANANKIIGAYDKYSNAEINAAEAAVVSTFAALEKNSINVPVGDIEIEITPDEDLPVNERVDTKYVLGWMNPDGTQYEGTTYVEGLIAQFVETKMMTVKYQLGNGGDRIRYIASVDALDRYNAVGWLFSVKNDNPELGGENVTEKKSSTVYTGILANGVEKSPADIYGEVDYSQYLYVFEITNIPDASADTVIYVRPYVEMEDGRIVYGDVSARTLNALKAK